jgi:hypothetical protein
VWRGQFPKNGWNSLIGEFFSTKYIFWHNTKMSRVTYVFFSKHFKIGIISLQKNIFSMQLKFCQIFVSLWYELDLALDVDIVKFHGFEGNHCFGSKITSIWCQPWIFMSGDKSLLCSFLWYIAWGCSFLIEAVEWPLKCEYDRLINDSWACTFRHVTVPCYPLYF